MNLFSRLLRSTWASAAFFGLLALPGATFGDAIAGSSSGVFVNPLPTGGAISVGGVGTSTFNWGNPDGFGTGPNIMSFTGDPFSTTTETPFKIGTLYYFNGTTETGTVPLTVQLSVGLDFTTPPAGPVNNSAFTLGLVSTPNTGTPEQQADYVYFPTAFSATTFTVGGTTYTLKLTGFQNIQGGVLNTPPNQFHVYEDSSATADLYGIVTTDLSGVTPEPSTLLISVIGGGALLVVARRRRRVS
jgi:hypothetical protein